MELDDFAAMALAGLHSNVPEAVRSQAIQFRMKPRLPSEKISSFRRRDTEGEAAPIREGLAGWLDPLREQVPAGRPRMPKGVEDRSAEIWEPLIIIAYLAGGDWPTIARDACKHFVFAKSGYARLIGVDLLEDPQKVFNGAEKMASTDIVTALRFLPDGVWDAYQGAGLSKPALATLLRPFDVRPKTIRLPSGITAKGYVVAGEYGLGEPWERHLHPEDEQGQRETADTPAPLPPEAVTPVTPVTPQARAPESVTASVTPTKSVTAPVTPPVTNNMPSTSIVTAYAFSG